MLRSLKEVTGRCWTTVLYCFMARQASHTRLINRFRKGAEEPTRSANRSGGALRISLWAILCVTLFTTGAVSALETKDILPPEKAFRLSAETPANEPIRLTWKITDGYYLYRKKFDFASQTPGISLGEPDFPKGKIKQDEFFGNVEIFRDEATILVPVQLGTAGNSLALDVKYQGCADLGICYPPQKQTLNLKLPAQSGLPVQPLAALNIVSDTPNPLSSVNQAFKSLGLNFSKNDLLPADQAFRFMAEVKDSNTLRVDWQIADDYYLYREKFQFTLANDEQVRLGDYFIPHGLAKHDEAFGNVEVFYNTIGFDIPLIRANRNPTRIELTAKFQGCAERGVCYPPMEKTIFLDLPQSDIQGSSPNNSTRSEQSLIAEMLKDQTVWFTVLSFFGFGLLLAFTPCVFPMIPILSGLIIGHGERITTGHAFIVSLSYVVGSAITYTVFGVLAGLFGSNLQVAFQEPWIIVSFSAVFVLLAFSMFGFYDLQIPKSMQAKIASASNNQHAGTVIGAAIMGALSALIIGPCVAAPLAGALLYIGQSGDAVLGGLALFAMGMGMGAPLLIIGLSAGKLLPKAGAWMNATKAIFGVGLLAVAVWLMERILPAPVTMILWSLLLIIPAIYMSALDALPEGVSGWHKLWKGTGIFLLSYGILILIGVASGSTNPIRPLQAFALLNAHQADPAPTFERVVSVSDLDTRLTLASENGQWTMLDFYADWCISCKELEHYTFSDPQVQNALSKVILVQADVTKNSLQDKELLTRFDLVGPPAILFFGPDQKEREMFRIIGYKDANGFLQHLKKIGV